MLEISFGQVVTLITVLWVLVRGICCLRKGQINWKYECRLLLVYVCIVVVSRVVYFPYRLENGHVGHLHFDAEKVWPLWINPVPFVHMMDQYEGRWRNLFGNIVMFIPVGMVWPFCFRKLDSVGKTVLAGFGCSLFIELTQLLFYERGSDIDDLITNTAGALIGALLYFLMCSRRRKRQKSY